MPNGELLLKGTLSRRALLGKTLERFRSAAAAPGPCTRFTAGHGSCDKHQSLHALTREL